MKKGMATNLVAVLALTLLVTSATAQSTTSGKESLSPSLQWMSIDIWW